MLTPEHIVPNIRTSPTDMNDMSGIRILNLIAKIPNNMATLDAIREDTAAGIRAKQKSIHALIASGANIAAVKGVLKSAAEYDNMHICVVKLKALPVEPPNRWGIAASGNMTGLIATGIFHLMLMFPYLDLLK